MKLGKRYIVVAAIASALAAFNLMPLMRGSLVARVDGSLLLLFVALWCAYFGRPSAVVRPVSRVNAWLDGLDRAAARWFDIAAIATVLTGVVLGASLSAGSAAIRAPHLVRVVGAALSTAGFVALVWRRLAMRRPRADDRAQTMR